MTPEERARNLQTQLNSTIECPPDMQEAIAAGIRMAVKEAKKEICANWDKTRLKWVIDAEVEAFEEAAKIAELHFQVDKCPEGNCAAVIAEQIRAHAKEAYK